VAPVVAGALNSDGRLRPERIGNVGKDVMYPLWLLKYLPNMTAAHVSLVHGAQGPNSTIVTACAAGTQAVGEAFRLIARGDADIVLSGGADSRLDPLLILAYSALGALSPAQRSPAEVSRPFDGQRDGFVLGEGGGVLILEELSRAKKRGAVIYAEVLGLGTSFDAYAVTKPDPEARAPPAPSAGPCGRPTSIPPTSITSTPTAPARGSTTSWRRWPSSASSGQRPGRCRCRRSSRWSAT
jgi:3-oxoacyl-[acyl-carrier-protein] synthase II